MRDGNYFKYITKFKSMLNHEHLASNELTRNEQKRRKKRRRRRGEGEGGEKRKSRPSPTN